MCREQEASLYEGLKRMTKGRLDDQRGLEINAELPEFLRLISFTFIHSLCVCSTLVVFGDLYVKCACRYIFYVFSFNPSNCLAHLYCW